jgi:O-antigen/teichoic acid export membrane protein
MDKPSLSNGFWASVLQWSRLGAQAIVFLVVARFLSLAEIGAFAVAAAPLRFFQVVHKSGIEDGVVISSARAGDPAITSLFVVSMGLSAVVVLLSCLVAATIAIGFPDSAPIPAMMLALSMASVLYGIAAVPDGLLRRMGAVRALALRSLASQGLAACVALVAVALGAGVWALVGFTLLNAVLATGISVVMSGWQPVRVWPGRTALFKALAGTMSISGRALIGAAILPVLQLAIGAFGGLAAGGAFQIATRVMALLDAVTLAPLRFLALPRFSGLRDRKADLGLAVVQTLRLAGVLSAWVYLGMFSIAGSALTLLVGPQNAPESTRALQMLCLGGMGAAGAAVINQVLLGQGQARTALRLSVIQLCIALLVCLPLTGVSAGAVALGLTLTGGIMLVALLRALAEAVGTAPMMALAALGRPYLVGIVMAGFVIGLGMLVRGQLHPALTVMAQVTGGTVVFVLGLRITMPGALSQLLRSAP